MREIQLTKGYVALVDDEDFEWLCGFSWCVSNQGYAVRGVGPREAMRTVAMQNQIIEPAPGFRVDHINRNRLDNCRGNLRLCTVIENNRNSGMRRNNTSGYRGVCRRSDNGRWFAQIVVDGTHYHLGQRPSAEEAARLYDAAARECFGEFAVLNFPERTAT